MDQEKEIHVVGDKEDNYHDQVVVLLLNLKEDKLQLLEDFQNGGQNQGFLFLIIFIQAINYIVKLIFPLL